MAHDEALAARIRDALGATKGLTEKLMFGGICFMVNGNMVAGVSGKGDLIIRVGADAHDAAMKRPGVRNFEMGGRGSKGMLFVGPEGTQKTADLKSWIKKGLAFVETLPPKIKKAAKKKTKG